MLMSALNRHQRQHPSSLIEINGHNAMPRFYQFSRSFYQCVVRKSFRLSNYYGIKICLINNLGEHVLGLVGAIRNICFPLFHMENVYIQYNFPIPILLPVSMNHLAERGQMLEARVLEAFSARRWTNSVAVDLSTFYRQICQP